MGDFDPTKPVRTRDGRPARILATDAKSDAPIVAAVMLENDEEDIITYSSSGAYWPLNKIDECDLDLVNAPEVKEGWMNVYEYGSGRFYFSALYATKHLADENADKNARIACFNLSFEVGEGL